MESVSSEHRTAKRALIKFLLRGRLICAVNQTGELPIHTKNQTSVHKIQQNIGRFYCSNMSNDLGIQRADAFRASARHNRGIRGPQVVKV